MGQGRPIEIEWQETADELYQLYRAEKHLKMRQRLQFLWLIRKGTSVQESCQIAGIGERSGQRYLNWYRQGGVGGVLERRHGGHAPRQGFLTDWQKAALNEHTKSGTVKTVWDAIEWVKDKYDVEYSYEGMRGVLKRLRLNKKVPRPQHEKSDGDAQVAWKEKTLGDRFKEEGVDQTNKIGWADEMRLGLMSQVRRVWAPVGIKIVQKIQINYTYTYLHLVVDGIKGTIDWIWADNMKQESVIKAVTTWQEAGIDVLVWDGAPSHRSHAVQILRPVLITQPPYSPELNPAERVFEAIRAEVEGVIYATIAAKKKAVEKFLQKLSASPQRIKQLAGWAWIQDTVASLAIPAP